jgi:mycothiol synthase
VVDVGVRYRRLTATDLPRLSVEVARARDAGELRASSDPEGAGFLKVIAVEPDLVGLAFTGSDLVGFVSSEFKSIVVRPDHRRRGIGRWLVDLAETMERGRHRPNILIGRAPNDDAALAFLTATGFALHSVLWDLTLPADVPIAEPAWPAGLRARRYEPDRDLEAWVALFNVAFADHTTPLQLEIAVERSTVADPEFVAADTLVVEDETTGELVGFCATMPNRRDGVVAVHAEIWTIGVRPDRQGMGLGRQLLRWGGQYLRSIGARNVELSVNGRNERALGLYESEGYARTQTRERWARPVRSI